VFEDLRRCLALAGARFEDVVKLTFFVPDVADLAAVRAARDAVIDQATMPSARSKTEDSAAAPASGRTDGGAMPLPGSGTMVRAG
jgi:enamine deaminase RidA (YjgF/YER057c/UK114 family)